MHIRTPKPWDLPESAAASLSAYRLATRRGFLRSLAAGAVGAAFSGKSVAATAGFPDERNPDFAGTDLKVTPRDLVTSYNNFYEFGTDKSDPKKYANRGWQTEPWTVELAGLVRNPGNHDVNDLVKRLGGIEQRVYRHRCVEAWSMVIPWDGFALAKLVRMADPKEDAKYLKFTSFVDREHAIGQRQAILDWPYVEGLTLAEATNELAFIATGVFGDALPNQNGAPLRLVVPWKYGFKGIKSIVKIEFTSRKPSNTWNIMAPQEYGFYANVNPHVDHPRWSQASERVIGSGFFAGKEPTLMFNGYEKQVAALYKDLDLRRNF